MNFPGTTAPVSKVSLLWSKEAVVVDNAVTQLPGSYLMLCTAIAPHAENCTELHSQLMQGYLHKVLAGSAIHQS